MPATVPDATLEVIEMPALTVLNGSAAGEQIVAHETNGRRDAVFAANDLLAVGPAELIGHTSVELMARAIDSPSGDCEPQVRFRPELVVRESSRGSPVATRWRRWFAGSMPTGYDC